MSRKFFTALILVLVLGVLVSAAAAADVEQKGPFALSAASGGTDTFTVNIQVKDADNLEVKFDIDEFEGEWELVLEDPDGNELGSMTSAQFDEDPTEDHNEDDTDFKVELKGEIALGEYVLTFTNTGTEPAAVAGEYKVEIKKDSRYFYDPGAKIALYININVINIWGINTNGEGYEAIVIKIDDIKEKIKKYKHGKGHTNWVFVSFDDLDLEENVLLDESEDGKIRLYVLTTGEFQVMVGPFEDGTVQVFIYDGFPPKRVYRADFNVYTVLKELQEQ